MELSNRPSSLVHLFDKALSIGGNTHAREDIAAGVAKGRFQYWGDDNCAVITEILNFPRKRVLHIFIGAGKLTNILDKQLPKLVEFASENGCQAITATGRKGLIKRLPQKGFAAKAVMFELPLKGN